MLKVGEALQALDKARRRDLSTPWAPSSPAVVRKLQASLAQTQQGAFTSQLVAAEAVSEQQAAEDTAAAAEAAEAAFRQLMMEEEAEAAGAAQRSQQQAAKKAAKKARQQQHKQVLPTARLSRQRCAASWLHAGPRGLGHRGLAVGTRASANHAIAQHLDDQ